MKKLSKNSCKIGIDARVLQTDHRFRGIGTYARNLLKNLREKNELEYYFLVQGQQKTTSKMFGGQEVLVRKTNDPTRYSWWRDQLALPHAIKKNKFDLVHFLDQSSAPLLKTQKTIITVNDLFGLDEPLFGQRFKNQIKLLPIRHADKLIAISEYVKKDIVNQFKIDPAKIKVIYDAYDQELYCRKKDFRTIEIFRKKLLNKHFKRYLLHVGSYVEFEKRKNLDFLLETFKKISQEISDVCLIFVGKTGPESNRLISKAKSLRLSEQVIFAGYIKKEEDLPTYFQSAAIFLFPSLYEGFGLPPLEAMACGIPVISSNNSALPEIIGNAGMLIQPSDHVGWTKAAIKLLKNKELSKQLEIKGLKQAKKFSWEKCAQETADLYRETLKVRK